MKKESLQQRLKKDFRRDFVDTRSRARRKPGRYRYPRQDLTLNEGLTRPLLLMSC